METTLGQSTTEKEKSPQTILKFQQVNWLNYFSRCF